MTTSAAEELVSQRLILRTYRPSDAEAVTEAIEESRTTLEMWTPEIASRRGVAAVSAGLESLLAACVERRKVVYAMLDRRSRQFVGEVGLYTIDWTARRAKIGLWLRASARGRGLGSEGFSELAIFARETLGLQVIEAHVHPRNLPSRRLMERAGFRLQGIAAANPRRDGTEGIMLVYALQP